MLENCDNAQERWGGVNDIIDTWLDSRRALIVRFCSLSKNLVSLGYANSREHQTGLDLSEIKETISLGPDNQHALSFELPSFCQRLIDYTSAAHFEVYVQLLAEAHAFQDQNALDYGKTLMEQIHPLTQSCVDFSDKYAQSFNTYDLVYDLDALGMRLESRFELEDAMISNLHTVHRALAIN